MPAAAILPSSSGGKLNSVRLAASASPASVRTGTGAGSWPRLLWERAGVRVGFSCMGAFGCRPAADLWSRGGRRDDRRSRCSCRQRRGRFWPAAAKQNDRKYRRNSDLVLRFFGSSLIVPRRLASAILTASVFSADRSHVPLARRRAAAALVSGTLDRGAVWRWAAQPPCRRTVAAVLGGPAAAAWWPYSTAALATATAWLLSTAWLHWRLAAWRPAELRGRLRRLMALAFSELLVASFAGLLAVARAICRA